MKKVYCFLVSLSSLYGAQAQNEVCYTYDAAGNRTQRALCCTNCSVDSGEDRQQTAVISATNSATIVPNPSTGIFMLHSEGIPANAQVLILDIDGHLLIQRLLNEGQFDISAYQPGTYVLHLLYGDQRKTLLIEKLTR